MSKVIDNIEDIASIDSKAVLTTTQTALDLKAPLASPALTGTPTSPTAVAGTNTTQLATTAFVKAKSELDSIGVNQTWQDMTSQRAIGSTYTNSTGKPIVIRIQHQTYNNAAAMYLNTSGLSSIINANGNAAWVVVTTDHIILSGASYSLTVSGNASYASLQKWQELR